ncbi:MAG TPA: hypothetical protein VGC27_07810, partial [Rhizomicrobium sp.]
YLGAISHTLTAAGALAQAGVRIAALVVNDSGDGAVPMEDTVAALARFLPGISITTISRAPEDAVESFARLAERLTSST